MASTPDSPHAPEPGSIELTDAQFDGRDRPADVEQAGVEPDGPDGTAGTDGDNKVQDELER